jgi:hypothetical protein
VPLGPLRERACYDPPVDTPHGPYQGRGVVEAQLGGGAKMNGAKHGGDRPVARRSVLPASLGLTRDESRAQARSLGRENDLPSEHHASRGGLNR